MKRLIADPRRYFFTKIFILILAAASLPWISCAKERLYSRAIERKTFLYEDFNTLHNWKPFTFSSIPRHTSYTVRKEGSITMVEARSDRSASGIILGKYFNVRKYPLMKWRWRIANTYKKGDATKKEGDDYPMRVYVIFRDEVLVSPFSYPHSSLNYIWSNRQPRGILIPNAYTDKSMMVVLEEGEEKAGRWIEEKVNIVEDYRKAFGEDSPSTATIGIMNDSDNTGESSRSFVDYIEIYGNGVFPGSQFRGKKTR